MECDSMVIYTAVLWLLPVLNAASDLIAASGKFLTGKLIIHGELPSILSEL